VAVPLQAAWRRWLLVRHRVSAPTDLTAVVVFAPQTTPRAEAARVAGIRWTIESCFEAAKGTVGLDHYEVRSWTGWYRHSTLAMWAYALLTVMRARHLQEGTVPKKILSYAPPFGRVHSSAEPWVPLSVPEVCRLFGRLVLVTKPTIGQILDWSAWRRWHQGIAQYYHYRRRAGPEVQL
jgi:hypothetical protein